MAVTGVGNTTAYGNYYTDTRQKTAESDTAVDTQKVETAVQTSGSDAAKNSQGQMSQMSANGQMTGIYKGSKGWNADSSVIISSTKVTTRGPKEKSFLQKMRERAEEIRLKNLRKKAKAEKRAAELATKKLERKKVAMRHSKVNYRV